MIAGSALAGSGSHTLTFDAVNASSLGAGPNAIGTDILKHDGHIRGEDLAYCIVGKSAAHCNISYAITGGMIYALYTATPSSARGVITGGTGIFKGITVTLKATTVTKKLHHVTLTYRK